MSTEQIIQGRFLTAADISFILHLLRTEPGWHRTRLSQELCRRWGWRNEAGRLKDMACRTMLLKLERQGQIRLPASRGGWSNALRNRRVLDLPCDRTPITDSLARLRPLRIVLIEARHPDAAFFRFLLQRHHYLGLGNTVGENLKYLARDCLGRPLACLLFSAAAWKAQSRDAFIGWDASRRQARLSRISDNSRFLILPWVTVPHLASHLLAAVTRRINADWRNKYGHGIDLLETFVERDRFRGTCYRAAGWLHVGSTTGRSRNDRHKTLRVPVKDIYLKPLAVDFRRRLCAPACSLPEGRAGR